MSDDGEGGGQPLFDHALRQRRRQKDGAIGQKFGTGAAAVHLAESVRGAVSRCNEKCNFIPRVQNPMGSTKYRGTTRHTRLGPDGSLAIAKVIQFLFWSYFFDDVGFRDRLVSFF